MHTQAASLPKESLNACYQNNIQYLSQQAAQQEVAGGGNQVQEMVPRQNGWLCSHMWIIDGESMEALWQNPSQW